MFMQSFILLQVSNQSETRQRALVAFSNVDEIHSFHAGRLWPELERCGANPAAVARAFLANCREMRRLYCHYCGNMAAARRAVQDLGGEQSQGSILVQCQQEAGHQVRNVKNEYNCQEGTEKHSNLSKRVLEKII